MGEKKFTSKEFIAQCKRCPDLAYECTLEEVLEGVKKFLQYVGYEILPETLISSYKAEFYAKRHDYEIAGILRYNMQEMADGLTNIRIMKEAVGDKIDCILTLPPVHELWLHEFFASEEGIKWFTVIKDEGLLIWLCNPMDMTVCSLFNAPRDKLFKDYFGAYSYLDLMGMVEGLLLPFKVTSEGMRRIMKKQRDEVQGLFMFK